MPRKIRIEIEPDVEVHDHFDGSSNCVQCGGECRLKGPNLVVTELVRWMLEDAAMRHPGAWVNMMAAGTLRRAGVDVEAFQKRAVETSHRAANVS